MKLIDKIINNVIISLNYKDSIYIDDYHLCMTFIKERNFEALSDIIISIIRKEEKKRRRDRIPTMVELIQLNVLVKEYLSQFEL